MVVSRSWLWRVVNDIMLRVCFDFVKWVNWVLILWRIGNNLWELLMIFVFIVDVRLIW